MSIMKNSLGLDPKKFTHVFSDNKKTTLKHRDGHTLTIMHSILSPKMQTQLKALANVGKENQTNIQAQEAEDQGKRKMAKGGNIIPYDEVSNYAEGGETNVPEYLAPNVPMDSDQVDVSPQVSQQEEQSGAKSAGQALGKAFINNPKVKLADAALKGFGSVIQQAPEFVSGLTNPNSNAAAPSMQQSPQPQMMAPPESVAQPQAQQQTLPPDPVTQSLQASQNLLDQGFQNEMAGNKQQGAAQIQQAKEQAQQLDNNINIQAKAQEAYQSKMKELDDEYQDIRHDIEQGHIDPDKYWTGDKNGNGGHSKIMAGLGMILGGFNPTNNPNAAVNFLKFQMEQNLNAQSKNLDSQQNLLRANLQQYDNQKRDAFDATRLQQAAILHNQMLMAANKAATPTAQAAMLTNAGKLQMEFAPLKQQFAMRQAMMSFMNGGTNGDNPSDTRAAEHMLNVMRMTSPEQAKEMESRLIPGVGLAKVPVPNEARNQITAHSKLENALNDLESFTKTHTTMIPGTKDYNVGAQKAMIVQTMLREGLLNTVYREGEQPLLDKLIKGNPANLMKEFNTLPQIKELKRNNMSQGNSLNQQYGLPTKQMPEANDMVTVMGPDGRSGKIPQKNLQKALSQGYRAIK